MFILSFAKLAGSTCNADGACAFPDVAAMSKKRDNRFRVFVNWLFVFRNSFLFFLSIVCVLLRLNVHLASV